MTTFLLIRHASHDWLGKGMAGRMPGVLLNAEGIKEAKQLAERLAHSPLKVSAVYSSPLERARQTAEPIASTLGLQVDALDALQEMDLGEWTGVSFEELLPMPEWKQFNLFRSGTRPPGGESMVEVQARIVKALNTLRAKHGDDTVAMVSHGDVIKSALMYFLGVPLDFFLRLHIAPASVSALQVSEYGPKVLFVNNIAGLIRLE